VGTGNAGKYCTVIIGKDVTIILHLQFQAAEKGTEKEDTIEET